MSVEVSGLTFAYDRRCILDGVSFCMRPGESVAIMGANGAGKSTLLWCVLGLLKARGTVRLFGGKPGRKALARCGVVFQNPEDQLFMPSLLEDVALAPANRGLPRDGAMEALRQVGLERSAAEPASRLSLGQRKRAAIAVALAACPDLLVLDEPTAELDGRSARELAATLCALPVGKLMASHDLAFVRRVATRALVLDGGSVIADAPVSDILGDEPLLARAGLI